MPFHQIIPSEKLTVLQLDHARPGRKRSSMDKYVIWNFPNRGLGLSAPYVPGQGLDDLHRAPTSGDDAAFFAVPFEVQRLCLPQVSRGCELIP